jgi:alkylated DNA repair protein (DNA oxidative demethylase)
MSVAMTNCGELGWVADRSGYRYDPVDPLTQTAWPRMPQLFAELARRAAEAAGFASFRPEACLINRYEPGTRLSLHRDYDEENAHAPIVSISIGAAATFIWGGLKRNNKTRRLRLDSSDVVVWGGPSRFVYHGVAPLKEQRHPLTGAQRINLTFRKVRR